MGENNQKPPSLLQKIVRVFFLYFKKLLAFIKRPAVRILIFVLIGLFTALYFANQYQDFLAAMETLEISTGRLLLALLLTAGAVTLGTVTWWALLAFLGHPRPWLATAKGYIHAALAKYIPGFIWHFAGRAYFSDEIKVPVKTTSIGFIIELMVTALVGGTLTALLFIWVGHQFVSQALLLKAAAGLIAVLLAVLIALFPRILKELLEKYFDTRLSLQNQHFYLAVLLNLLGWILMGLVFYLTLRALGIEALSFIDALFFHCASFVAGTLAVPFPNGLLVRETILILLGGGLLNQQIFILASLLLRLLILAAEVVLNVLLALLVKIPQGTDRPTA